MNKMYRDRTKFKRIIATDIDVGGCTTISETNNGNLIFHDKDGRAIRWLSGISPSQQYDLVDPFKKDQKVLVWNYGSPKFKRHFKCAENGSYLVYAHGRTSFTGAGYGLERFKYIEVYDED